MHRAPRQPVGIYPEPASLLLLPAAEDEAGALDGLLRGDLSDAGPDAWRFFVAAARGGIHEALRLLGDAEDDLAAYNRFALDPSADRYRECEQRLSGELLSCLQWAAYANGLTDLPPSGEGLADELLAMSLACASAADLESSRHAAAADKLQRAATAARVNSPVFAAMLLGQRAELLAAEPDPAIAPALTDLAEAQRLAEDADAIDLRGELLTKRGMLWQRSAGGSRGAILEAIQCYQTALQRGIDRDARPGWYAQVQNNLGLAYLSLPEDGAGSHLRSGFAVQCFRHALEVYTREVHPDMWASVSMNLANALQHVPSSHRQDNLIEAVQTYEEVLQVRLREKDPVAYALVLLNQANALAHLGIFKPALEKLAEACKLFSWHECHEQAATARELIDLITEHRATVVSETEAVAT